MKIAKEILAIREYKDGNVIKNKWSRIGVGISNRDGSINLIFDFFPTNPTTKIQIRDYVERADRVSYEPNDPIV